MTMGATNPGMVATVLDIPNRRAAYLGAMSTWLSTNPPPYWKPIPETPITRMTIAQTVVWQSTKPKARQDKAGTSKPTIVKINFKTVFTIMNMVMMYL